MIIRKAQPEDSIEIHSLIIQLAIFEKQPDAVITTPETLETYLFSEVPLIQCYVAEVLNKVVGIALFYYRYSTWKGKTIHLEDLIVDKEFRNKGIGNKLFEKVIKTAYNEKVGRMEWEALAWNAPALDFYKKVNTTFDDEWVLCKLNEKEISDFIKRKRS